MYYFAKSAFKPIQRSHHVSTIYIWLKDVISSGVSEYFIVNENVFAIARSLASERLGEKNCRRNVNTNAYLPVENYA